MPPRRAILAAPFLAIPALAQTRPMRIVVPFPPGGSLDIMTRLLQPLLAERLGQAVMIDNRPGGGTIIGTDAVAKAAPDGTTALMVANSFTINAALVRNPPFDARRDFTGVASVGYNPHVLVVTPGLASDLAGLLALGRATPGGLSYASFGQGTSGHLGGESFRTASGLTLIHVPYRGAAQAMQDVVGGRVAMMLSNLADAIPLVRGGRLTALALADTARHPQFPDVPTFDEAGLPGVVSNSWFGLVARADNPVAMLDGLHGAIDTVLTNPVLLARFDDIGVAPRSMPRPVFDGFLSEEFTRSARVIRDAGITAD